MKCRGQSEEGKRLRAPGTARRQSGSPPLLRVAWGGLLVLGLQSSGCDGVLGVEEEPPARLRSLKQPRWEVHPGDVDAAGVVTDVGARPQALTPTPAPAPVYKGVTQTVLDAFQRSELRDARSRALNEASASLSEADVAQAFAAIQSGRTLDATVGIALLSRYYERAVSSGDGKEGAEATPRWDRLEEAYRTLFQAVPAMRLSPEHLAEHAVSLAMLERFGEALAEARAADELFRSLPVGADTRPHLSRLAQAQAWSYEGLARESIKKGAPDAETRSLQQLALVSWERYVTTARAMNATDPAVLEELRRAEEHLANLRQSAALSQESRAGGAP